MNVSGVLETQDTVNYELISYKEEEAIFGYLEVAVAELAAYRQPEGGNLKCTIKFLLNTLAQLCKDARTTKNVMPQFIRAKFKNHISKLLESHRTAIEDRIAQKVDLLSIKTNIHERIDRLETHCTVPLESSSESKLVGKRVQFLCQESNRGANKFYAKFTDNELTRIRLELKAIIDQIREQVKNLEYFCWKTI